MDERGAGVKNCENLLTSFMDGPLSEKFTKINDIGLHFDIEM